ncbi:MAG: M48 family metalloprotease [Bacteriovoracaceae bacterium]
MKNLKNLACLLLVATFAACKDQAVPLNFVHVTAKTPSSGRIIVKGEKGELVAGFMNSTDSLLNFGEVKTYKIKFENSFDANGSNAPGMAPSTFKIEGQINVEIAKGELKIELDDSDFYINAEKFSKKKINCNGKISLSADVNTKTLNIDFGQINTVADCEGNHLKNMIPQNIGKREISKAEDISTSNFLDIGNALDRYALNNQYDENQDIELGKQYAEEFIKQNQKYVLPKDHPMTVYMQQAMENIANVSDNPRIIPHVYIINAEVLNAFALPGGYVFVFRGLIDATKKESQLMGVLGHEWAHVVARHGTRAVSRGNKMTEYVGQGLQGLSGIEFVKNAAPAIKPVASGIVLQMINGKDAEREADRLGSQYAWAARYQPWGISETFEIFNSIKEDKRNFLENFMASHPEHGERIKTGYLLSSAYYSYNGPYISSTPEYLSAKAELLKLPIPPKEESKAVGQSFANNFTNMLSGEMLKDLINKYGPELQKELPKLLEMIKAKI